MVNKEHAPADTQPVEAAPATPAAPTVDPAHKSKLGTLKLAFLYVLIGGLVISALISVVAILIGEFNSIISKAITTTVSLVVHSSLMLLIILADKNNQLGKSVIPTSFLVVVIANMITSSLGIWGVWGDDLSWRFVNVYAFLIGIAFMIAGLLRMRIQKQLMQTLSYTSIGLVILLGLIFTPWILFFDASWVNEAYYRIISATAILAVTSVVITSIVNRILVSQHKELANTVPAAPKYSGGMLGITISLGVITAIFWLVGLTAFVYQATTFEQRQQRIERQQERQNKNTYDYDNRNYNRYE